VKKELFSFKYNFYNEKVKNIARCEMMGTWLNLKSRKLNSLPQRIYDNTGEYTKIYYETSKKNQ
tara:strand:- start:81 stop:272 length:192 start_codon:yes stop_codon:yes gene_type:complete